MDSTSDFQIRSDHTIDTLQKGMVEWKHFLKEVNLPPFPFAVNDL